MTSLYAITSPTSQESAPSHWPPDRWIDDFLLRERKNPPPIFTFWPFELWPALPLPGLVAGRALLLFLPPLITWTLSHCSCHPKQLYFIWELIVPTTHTHRNNLHRSLYTKCSLLTYLQTYSTCKYYQTWLRSTPWHVQTRIYCFILFINGESAFCN